MIGLSLEGGGARGAYHMGVVEALYSKGYTFGAVTGTSIGAINGAVIAQGDFNKGYTWWQKIDTALLFDFEHEHMQKLVNKKIDKSCVKYFCKKLKEIILQKGIDTKIIRAIIGDVVAEDKLRISPTDFGLVTICFPTFKPLEVFKCDIPTGRMIDYIIASARLPIFKSVPIDNKHYLDGGFYNNLPVNLLVKSGYKKVIAVRTADAKKRIKYDGVDVLEIIPSDNLGKLLDFNPEIIKSNIKLGYDDTICALKNFCKF